MRDAEKRLICDDMLGKVLVKKALSVKTVFPGEAVFKREAQHRRRMAGLA